jgi:hypothetical protein
MDREDTAGHKVTAGKAKALSAGGYQHGLAATGRKGPAER